MRCPVCGHDTNVSETRVIKDGTEIRRRRNCPGCSHRFTTYERAEQRFPTIVKRDGRRERFDEDKIIRGLVRACGKRPVSREKLDEVAKQITRSIHEMSAAEVPSDSIGELVLGQLADIDPVAYIRFASVYMAFEDSEDFKNIIENLEIKRSKSK